MRARRLLIACYACCSLLLVLGCGDDGEVAKETNCTDGVDNDGDGQVDCLDVDCADHADCHHCGNGLLEPTLGEDCRTCPVDCNLPLCGNGSCEEFESSEMCPEDCAVCDDGFCEGYETELSCPQDCVSCDALSDLWEQVGCPGEACTLVGQGEAGCAPTGTNAHYADCSNDEGCLAGAFCSGDGSFERCLPFCDLSTPTAPTCPGGGSCVWVLDLTDQPIAAEIGLCDLPVYNCDPVDNIGCTAPEECFMVGSGSDCAEPTANPATPGNPCDQDDVAGCVTGSSCFNTGTEMLCFEVCNLSDGSGCDGGTCQDAINSPDYGTCQ